MEDGSSGVLSQSLPDEIIMEILIRLPVKSLVRFRSVSKSWHYLISNKKFAELHLKTAVSDSQYSFSRLLCVFGYPRNHFREYSLPLMLHQSEVDPMIVDYAVGNSNLIMRIVGSCRGMVCIAYGEDHFILWNPSIRKYKCLPCLHIWSRDGCHVEDGFGYVEETDDYKVMAVSYSIFEDGPFSVYLYSLKSDEWKRIEDFNYGIPVDHSAEYAYGKLHWLVDCDGYLDIVSLDLITEKFEKVDPPHTGANRLDERPCVALGLFSGKLCALFDDNWTFLDVWVMQEYGVKTSWTKVLVLPYLGNPGYFPHMLRMWQLNNGKVLLLYGSVIAVYNLVDKIWYIPEIHESVSIRQSDVYVESLISPCAW